MKRWFGKVAQEGPCCRPHRPRALAKEGKEMGNHSNDHTVAAQIHAQSKSKF